MYIITVDAEKCVGDGNCVEVCPVGVCEFRDNKAVVVNPDECLGLKVVSRSVKQGLSPLRKGQVRGI